MSGINGLRPNTLFAAWLDRSGSAPRQTALQEAMAPMPIWDARRGVAYQRASVSHVAGRAQPGDYSEAVRGVAQRHFGFVEALVGKWESSERISGSTSLPVQLICAKCQVPNDR